VTEIKIAARAKRPARLRNVELRPGNGMTIAAGSFTEATDWEPADVLGSALFESRLAFLSNLTSESRGVRYAYDPKTA